MLMRPARPPPGHSLALGSTHSAHADSSNWRRELYLQVIPKTARQHERESEDETERIRQHRDREKTQENERDASDQKMVVKWKNTNWLLGEINIYCLIDGIS